MSDTTTIYRVEQFEDDKGRSIIQRTRVLGDMVIPMSPSGTTPEFYGRAVVTLKGPMGAQQHIHTPPFKIEAKNLSEAFGCFEEAAQPFRDQVEKELNGLKQRAQLSQGFGGF